MKMLELKGVSQLLKRLQVTDKTMSVKAGIGLVKAGKFLQRESQKIVPVQLGDLKNSAFTRRFGLGWHTDVIVGYTMSYAAYVHEDMDKAHGKDFNIKHADEISHAKTNDLKSTTAAGGMFNRGENQQAKFLEMPAKRDRHKLITLIANEIK